MKKTIITSFITILLVGGPVAYASELVSVKTDKPATVSTKDSTNDTKVETLDVRRDKIEIELRATLLKIKAVVERTQTVIDLLNKNQKDTTEASKFLLMSKSSMKVASDSLDQFSSISIPESNTETKDLNKDVDSVLKTKVVAPQSLKDSLKKAEDSLKDSKNYLISSISALKESLSPSPKEDN